MPISNYAPYDTIYPTRHLLSPLFLSLQWNLAMNRSIATLSFPKRLYQSLFILLSLLLHCTSASTQSLGSDRTIDYLKGLSLEDLLQTKVTSPSKKPEKLVDATAAIFVITAEDIERSGIRTIPDALRMVPGVQASLVNGSNWAISARGFGDIFSDKLLVLMDGRSVYTSLFSGVYWSFQDTVIEDIERIEVIRGPGATLWGANAVNGVINIITKSAEDTQGTLLSLGTGNREPLIASGRQGGTINDKGYYRIFAKGVINDGHFQANGDDAFDGLRTLRGGFKTELDITNRSHLTLQGEIVRGKQEIQYYFPGLLIGNENLEEADFIQANLIGRWQQNHGENSSHTLQAYYDFSEIEAISPNENRHTFDLDFQYKFMATPFQEVIWGLGYRVSHDSQINNDIISLIPASSTEHLYSGFIQDEIELLKDKWWLTLGSKFEHNHYSGFEVQPNVRLRWKPLNNHTLWATVSRAVRTPSRGDHDLIAYTSGGFGPFGDRFKTKIVGQDSFDSEELIAYEAGYRWSPCQVFSMDTALFYNVYDNLRSLDPATPELEIDSISPYIALPLHVRNGISAENYGVEFLMSWQPFPQWKLAMAYSFLHVNLSYDQGTVSTTQQFQENDFPEHQFNIRSYMDLAEGWSFDSELYYVDELSGRNIDAYLRLDLRLSWQLNDELSLSLSGENLLESQNSEFDNANSIVSSEVPRLFFAKIVWDY